MKDLDLFHFCQAHVLYFKLLKLCLVIPDVFCEVNDPLLQVNTSNCDFKDITSEIIMEDSDFIVSGEAKSFYQTWQRWNIFCMSYGKQSVFFQFKIIINVLVSSLRFIWIPMLWVYGHYKYL